MDDMSDAEDEPEAQVNDWRFSELQTTDLAALREVDVSAESQPLSDCQSSSMRIGKESAPQGQNVPATAHRAAIKGLMRAKHPTKQRLNSFWFKMYCHGTSKDPDPSALRAAVTSFPYQYKDEGVVQYRQI